MDTPLATVEGMLVSARRAAGLTQGELARRAGTSRPTLSAYEHGRKSPTMQTAQRVLAAAGHRLEVARVIEFHEQHLGRSGRSVVVATALPRLGLGRAFARVLAPLHLQWSEPGRMVDLADRRQRARFYEVVLREGGPEDIATYVDGALLVDLWSELVLPDGLRRAWDPLIAAALRD